MATPTKVGFVKDIFVGIQNTTVLPPAQKSSSQSPLNIAEKNKNIKPINLSINFNQIIAN